jgi:hypothetical protein
LAVFKDTEVSALQATIVELEEKLLKVNLQAKRATEAKVVAEELLHATQSADTSMILEGGPDEAGFASPEPASASASAARSTVSPTSEPSEGAPSPLSPTRIAAAAAAAESKDFLLKLERELIATGISAVDKNGDPSKIALDAAELAAALAQSSGGASGNNVDVMVMKFLNIPESELKAHTASGKIL